MKETILKITRPIIQRDIFRQLRRIWNSNFVYHRIRRFPRTIRRIKGSHEVSLCNQHLWDDTQVIRDAFERQWEDIE